MMIALDKSQTMIVKPLFEYTSETLILSYLQGYMGRGWVDNINTPTCAQILVGDFSFVAGNYESETAVSLVKNIPYNTGSPWFLIIPQNESWGHLIESCYPERSYKIIRYATKKDTAFSITRLQSYIDCLPSDYQLVRINEELYLQCLKMPSMKDLCSQFLSANDYLQRGLGFCILYKGNIVCGASSYSVYDGGIEIEVDTDEKYRRQGLATVCASRLILECLREGKYPSWDAANNKSIEFAKKLGYEFAHEYTTYAIDITESC